ncbi:hypothetical protein V490_07462 [Pseudogymnoascus sp. VKM F-3557]|nr:hypothetical protein V490_07462 [Pseudogymnoascus sp. VKM F-3557]
MACELQNPKATSSSSDDWSCHRTPLLSKPGPAYLQPSAQNPKEDGGTTYKNLLNNHCRHKTPYNDKGLRIISKMSNGFDTFYEVDIAGSKFWAQRERLEASFVGRWLLADYEPRGLAYVFRSQNSETPQQAGLHLVYNGPGVFSVAAESGSQFGYEHFAAGGLGGVALVVVVVVGWEPVLGMKMALVPLVKN